MSRPYGLLTWVSENPDDPFPISVETVAANAGLGTNARSAAFSKSLRFISGSLTHRRAFPVEVPEHAALRCCHLFAHEEGRLQRFVKPPKALARVLVILRQRAVSGDDQESSVLECFDAHPIELCSKYRFAARHRDVRGR